MNDRSELQIDLNILGENIKKLGVLAPINEVLFMVKADAYGHGMVPLVSYCLNFSKIREFGVATCFEARQLRSNLPLENFEIYVFSDLNLEKNRNFYKEFNIIPVIYSLADLNFFLFDSSYKNVPLCLKFNTGMNRLGFEEDDVEEVVSMMKTRGRSSVYHLMTHLSSASLLGTNKRNTEQKNRFKNIKDKFEAFNINLERTSISNSGAIEQGLGLEETHIRPGLMLYGPTNLIKKYRTKSNWKGETISSLQTYIIKTSLIKKGTPIGYGASPCPDDGLLAILALGYGDGFSTNFEGAHIFHKGHKGKIVGRVNMDMTHVLFSKESAAEIKTGDKVKIWGHEQSELQRFLDETGSIPYEIFCQLTGRVPRNYNLKELMVFKEEDHGKKLAY
ncbi:MAG: alanine racemase [Epsilonproteobacteria bacterium]|nr:MAG: alanine racemase [Campylobacterota bacterium]